MIDIKRLIQTLALHRPVDLSTALESYAAVAVMIRVSPDQRIWLGYIRRAIHEGDRWSGHVAFPGGKHEPQDPTSLHTAVRETFEEVGITLSEDAHIGRLDDIQARGHGGLLPFYIRPHVFVLDEEPPVLLDQREVAAFEWVALDWIVDPFNKRIELIEAPSGVFDAPAIAMPDGSVLWGLTLRITESLLDIARSHGV